MTYPKFRKITAEEYPNPPGIINELEAMSAISELADKVKDYEQIVGVSRSGMPYAAWIAQLTNKDMGYFNPRDNGFCLVGKPKSIVFIDNTLQWGGTALGINKFMQQYPNIEYAIGVVWVDCFSPHLNGHTIDNVVHAHVLTKWVTNFFGFIPTTPPLTPRYRDQV